MSFFTRNTTKTQYETALWFVRFMHHKSGIVASALEYLDYYNGFQRTANRDGANYPEFINALTFAIALNAWQNNPNSERAIMTERDEIVISYPQYAYELQMGTHDGWKYLEAHANPKHLIRRARTNRNLFTYWYSWRIVRTSDKVIIAQKYQVQS